MPLPLPPPPPLLPAAIMTDGASSSSAPPSRRGDATAVGTAVLPVPSTSTRPAGSERGYKPDAPNGSRIQRQDWSRLHVDGPQLDGWYITKIVLRSISCILMLTMVAMYLVIIVPSQSLISSNVYVNRLNAPIASGMHAAFGVFAFFTLAWDLTEFVTMCCRRGYGITPKAHIGIELTLFLWGAGTISLVAILAVVPVWYARYFPRPSGFTGVEEVTSVAVMGGTIVIIRFILFVRNAIDRCGGRGLTPRIMYLQTGEPVVVMRRPYPPPPTGQEPDIEMGDRTTTQPTAGAATLSAASTLVVSPPRTSLWGMKGRKLRGKKAAPSSSPQPTSPEAPESTVVSSPQEQQSWSQEQIQQESEQPQPQAQQQQEQGQQQHTRSPPSSPQQVPRRKPVPGRGTGPEGSDNYGPTPAYEPDEAERRRAERGEAQAQWMTLEDMGIRGPASGKRRGEAGENADRQVVGGRDLEDSRWRG
ncbi:hypothetical protein RB595_004195 [Gaeumannomyces hyphopodioides]